MKILLGITGGIAAYKTLELIRILRQQKHDVKVITTKAAELFVTPLSIETLSNHKIYQDMFVHAMEHIELARWADFILVAPASANFIAKLSTGLSDDLLSTVCLVAKSKNIGIAPAMNKHMWANIATQTNIQTLHTRNIKIFGPDEGEQICGDIGFGRMLEPKELAHELHTHLNKTNTTHLCNKNVMITAGPTIEELDPVRYFSNYSSGKMGYALAYEALSMGANVTLISGPTTINDKLYFTDSEQEKLTIKKVTSTTDMHNTVMHNLNDMHIFIGAAAVADYSPKTIESQKIKKQDKELHVVLHKNKDILFEVANKNLDIFTVGFAAETSNLIENATHKLFNKNIDMIVANSVANGKVFNKDSSEAHVIYKTNKTETAEVKLPYNTKNIIAQQVLNLIAKNNS